MRSLPDMTDPTRDDLLGYLLGALEEDEQAVVERALAENEGLRHDLTVLSRGLAPLDATCPRHDPPADLVERTCRFVWSEVGDAAPPVRPRAAARMRPVEPSAVGVVQYRWQDALVAAGVIVAASVLLFPALQSSRVQARLAACQNNLRELGASLAQFSQAHDGAFPRVPAQGRLAVASAFAPILAENHLLPNPGVLVCPDSSMAEPDPIHVPSLVELDAIDSPEQLRSVQEQMGGSYGYTLGYLDAAGEVHGARDLGRSQYALVSDAPSAWLPGRQSANHGHHGQNVLFEDGHVQFLVSPRRALDDFFHNDAGLVAAGVHADDSVIAAGATAPLPASSGQ